MGWYRHHDADGTRGLGVFVGLCIAAVMLTVAGPAAADSSSAEDDAVRAAPPASSNCQGPGCMDGAGAVQALLQLAGSGTGCGDGGVCFWRQDDFQGEKQRYDEWPCCDWYFVTDIDRIGSAKNRYANRKVQTGNASYQTSCMDPGENRPNLDFSDRFRIGAIGSRCG